MTTGALTVSAVQSAAWANKLAKGFNVTDVPLEFSLLYGEVAEAFDAWRKQGDVGAELADVLIFLVSVAEMTGVDLETATAEKLAQNAARQYRALPNGVLVKEAGQ
jgi:hypothetical protein